MNNRNQRNWLKAGEAADYLNVSYYTLRKYAQNGAIEHDSTPAGQMIFTKRQLDRFLTTYSKKYTGDTTEEDATPQAKAIAFYVRDSKGNQERLNRQKTLLTKAYGEPEYTYQDKASGLNENRKGLLKMIRDAKNRKFDTIAITAKDRLTRFGYKYLEILFNEYGCNILVLDYEKNDKSVYDELLQDFMSLVASFSGKFYKLRSLRHEQMLLDLAQSNVNEKINNKND